TRGRDQPAQSVAEAERANGCGWPRAIQVEPRRAVAGEGRPHDCGACRYQSRVGELLGFAHVRAEEPVVRPSRRLVVAFASCLAGSVWVGGGVVRAHEIGTTQVSALLPADRTYSIEIVTDAASLVEKLEASAGR